MRRLIKITLVMLFLLGLCGCMGPDFGSGYGYPSFGYAPYSYGWPAYGGEYAPTFATFHPWELHNQFGHENNFFHEDDGFDRFGGFGDRWGGYHGDDH
jgi:hypothetical protein